MKLPLQVRDNEIRDADLWPLAQCYAVRNVTGKRNAAEIVRRVNAYDKLVTVCNKLIEICDRDQDMSAALTELQDLYDDARAALIEEEEP